MNGVLRGSLNAETSHNWLKHLTHCPAMDYKEGFRGGVEGAGCQGIRLAMNDVAQVIIRMGRLAEGELGKCLIAVILMVKQVVQRVEEVT